MRWPRILLAALALFVAGFALTWLMSRGQGRGAAAGPERPPGLEQAWRARVAGKDVDVLRALDALGDKLPADARARDEVALLRAVATRDRRRLEQLAEGRGGACPAVRAGAQRALARGLALPEERPRWALRFQREFPGSWAQAELVAGTPR